MNRSSKLFVAAALLAAGYGVASLLGSPNAPYLNDVSEGRRAAHVGGSNGPSEGGAAGGAHFAGGVRLLPDVVVAPLPAAPTAKMPDRPIAAPMSAAGKDSIEFPLADRIAELPSSAPPETMTHVASPPIQTADAFDPSSDAHPAVRARLSDAPPRPLSSDQAGGGLSTTQPAAEIARHEDRAAAAPLARPSTEKAAPPAITSFATSEAGRSTRPNSAMNPPPPQLPAVAQRTHMIVDGDSLPKLAGRYLGDPQRGNEIFALNRRVLTSPELLPIGAELQIPARVTASGRGG